ncbi:TonB-dependent receptor plug domain-containing protein [Thalassobellus sediminis]|uniref:TonB-dependent receptor plug domain-containing protein n=1 Tax=Thalassobellus sediminis TaxID=3367753 RepID=UPI00379FC72C
MNLKSIIFLFIILISNSYLNSQNVTIRGIVKDELNTVLSNVSVKTTKSDIEVLTDSNGFYSITVTPKSKLIFSHQGFKKQKASVKGKDIINVFLKYDIKANKEKYVNTGYGKIKQSESTISTSSVDEKLIEQENNLDIFAYLQTIPGLSIVNNQIRIRGNRSLSVDDSPLIILNGSQYNAPLNNINPRDIKSIDVLKDASATVVYGSRGANGVILIKTK